MNKLLNIQFWWLSVRFDSIRQHSTWIALLMHTYYTIGTRAALYQSFHLSCKILIWIFDFRFFFSHKSNMVIVKRCIFRDSTLRLKSRSINEISRISRGDELNEKWRKNCKWECCTWYVNKMFCSVQADLSWGHMELCWLENRTRIILRWSFTVFPMKNICKKNCASY